jgi:pyruvate formate lyase activating enzyme
MTIKGIIFDIKKFALHDGPGIRTTVFMKGCPLDCWWCHNPESQKQTIEKIKKEYTIDNKILQLEEQIGYEISVEELLKIITQDNVFYDESKGGVTFSGGEPLLQHKFLLASLQKCKELGFHTTLDTCGYAEKAIFKQIIPFVDLFLYDIKILNKDKHKEYTSASNELILTNLQLLEEKKKRAIIRIPVIPTINTDNNELAEMGELLSKMSFIESIELLPYHQLGVEKYRKLGRENRMTEIIPPTVKQLGKIQKKLEEYNLRVKIEGVQ